MTRRKIFAFLAMIPAAMATFGKPLRAARSTIAMIEFDGRSCRVVELDRERLAWLQDSAA